MPPSQPEISPLAGFVASVIVAVIVGLFNYFSNRRKFDRKLDETAKAITTTNRADNDALKSEVSSSMERLLSARLDDKDKIIELMDKRMDTLEANSKLQAKMLDDQRTLINAQASDIERHNKRITQQDSYIKTLEGQFANEQQNNQNNVSRYERLLGERNTELQNALQQITEKNIEIERLSNELLGKEAELSTLRDRVTSLETLTQQQATQLEQQASQIGSLQTRLNDLIETLRQRDEQLADRDRTIIRLRTERDDAVARAAALQSQLDALSADIQFDDGGKAVPPDALKLAPAAADLTPATPATIEKEAQSAVTPEAK